MVKLAVLALICSLIKCYSSVFRLHCYQYFLWLFNCINEIRLPKYKHNLVKVPKTFLISSWLSWSSGRSYGKLSCLDLVDMHTSTVKCSKAGAETLATVRCSPNPNPQSTCERTSFCFNTKMRLTCSKCNGRQRLLEFCLQILEQAVLIIWT